MTLKVLENGAESFVTAGGITITRERHDRPYAGAIDAYVDGLNSRRGAVFSSNYEYPGRYTRWDTAIIDPPLAPHHPLRRRPVETGWRQEERRCEVGHAGGLNYPEIACRAFASSHSAISR